MPKIKKKESIFAPADRAFRSELARRMELYDIDKEELAGLVGLTYQTILRKIKEPETLKVSELRKMCRSLKIPPEIAGVFIAAELGEKERTRQSNAGRGI